MRGDQLMVEFSAAEHLNYNANSFSTVRFLGHPMQASYSGNIFGRVFRGTGEPIDGGPDLLSDPKVTIGGPSVNPVRRTLASKMIRTNVPMIDLFNCLVESQKIPILAMEARKGRGVLIQPLLQLPEDASFLREPAG
jgi:V/A-type H+/Na+-transporting ATPase subunit B